MVGQKVDPSPRIVCVWNGMVCVGEFGSRVWLDRTGEKNVWIGQRDSRLIFAFASFHAKDPLEFFLVFLRISSYENEAYYLTFPSGS